MFTETVTEAEAFGPIVPAPETVSQAAPKPVFVDENVAEQGVSFTTWKEPVPPGATETEVVPGPRSGTQTVAVGVTVGTVVGVADGEGVKVGVPGPGVGAGVLVRVGVAVGTVVPWPATVPVGDGVAEDGVSVADGAGVGVTGPAEGLSVGCPGVSDGTNNACCDP